MSDAKFDIEKIREILRAATTPGTGDFTQRGLAAAAGEKRDAVGDIIHGRNKNPTSKVLANLARAMGRDLSVFGLAHERTDPPTEDELEEALLEMLPRMPKGGVEKRARYLAESVGRFLQLPSGRQAIGRDLAPSGRPAGDAPPPATN